MTAVPPPPAADRFTLPAGAATPLAQLLSDRIRREGAIPFAAFMQTALYHEQLGYYRRGRATVGREGDFLTSPEVHPIFGYAIAAVIAEVWKRMQRPADFVVREIGPGTGAFVEHLFAWLRVHRPDLGDTLRVELIDVAPEAAAGIRERLRPLGDRIRWIDAEERAAPIRGVVFANELLDALPVHRLRWQGTGWEELYVGIGEEGCFRDAPGPVSQAALLTPLAKVKPSEEQIVEVCPDLGPLVSTLAASVGAGLLLLFDYGCRRAQLYAPWRRTGTLMTYYRHTPGEDPYVRVGEQDLTCHIDIDAVQAAAIGGGMRAYPVQSQAQFLAAIGATQAPAVAAAGQRAPLEAYLSRRRAIEVLSDPAGLGRIQALGFSRGIDGPLLGLGAPEV